MDRFVEAPNSKRKILLVRCPHWAYRAKPCHVLGKTFNAIIPTDHGVAQWTRAQVGNQKPVDSRFGFTAGQAMDRCVL